MRACRALAFALALALELARGCRGLGLALGALLVCSVPWWLPPLAAAYADALERHPYATNSLTGGVVMLLGDSFAQFLEFRQRWRRWVRPQRGSARAALQPFAIDGVRLAACVCFSAGFHMPVNTWWYHHAVEKLLPDADLSLRLPGLGKPPDAWFRGSAVINSAAWAAALTLAKAVLGVSPAWVLNPIFFLWVPSAEAVGGLLLRGEPLEPAALQRHIRRRFQRDLCKLPR